MQAIETLYNGHRFRSRLEAKWAVFFTRLGLKFEYEKEGFEIPALSDSFGQTIPAHRYLPDFWLPELHTWIEVKPDPFNSDYAIRMAAVFRYLGGGFVVWGLPNGCPREHLGQPVNSPWGNLVHRALHELAMQRYLANAPQAAADAQAARFEHGDSPSREPIVKPPFAYRQTFLF